ncbi:hypothetical protein O0L34_g5606 [Tuta absoluta]|nr:hypothetical protein O0L34_g5606 [Tuta absoluta]
MGSKKFLDWVARSNGNTSITSNLKRDSTHNPLKVVFTTARILTDHSLLLRWKIPEDITTVEGYEILINGRSVLKITSPSKNIAVLSCLPHAKQLRLTVRTLIIPSVDSSKAAFSTASATVVIPTYKKSLLYLEKLH